MNLPARRFWLPDQIIALIADIAELYSPKTAIDPCCEDIRLLQQCSFVKGRRAIFRDTSYLRKVSERFTDADLIYGDITKRPIKEKYDLVINFLPDEAIAFMNTNELILGYRVAWSCLDIIAPNGVCLLVGTVSLSTAPFFDQFRERVLNNMALDAAIEFTASIDQMFLNSQRNYVLLVIRNGLPHQHGTFLGQYDSQRPESLISAVRDGVGNFFVQKEDLRVRWDRHFHDPKHQKLESALNVSLTKCLGELGEITVNQVFPMLAQHHGEFLLLSESHLKQNGIKISEADRFINRRDNQWFEKIVVQPGDVVVSLRHPVAYVYRATDPPAVLGRDVSRIRSRDNDYIATYLNTPDGKALFEDQAWRHVRPSGGLSTEDIQKIRIPILPIDNLNSIGNDAIKSSSPPELESLRQQLLLVKQRLEFAEAELETKRQGGLQPSETILKMIRFVATQNAKILDQQQATNAKLDHIVYVLASMRDDIGGIKQSSRDDEEKLARIAARIDAFTESTVAETKTYREYVEVVQTWLNRWETLDSLTQKFLPSAEQIYDLLERQTDADFSPFVLQYCRALENEILTKLFSAYNDDVRKRVPDVAAFVARDLQIENTKRFARCVRDDNRRYTLGDMSFTMQLLKPGGRTLADSSLLQDFRNFTITYFDKRVAEKKFLDQVKYVNEEFRVKAAHPYLMTKEVADKCSALVRVALSELIDFYRTGKLPLHEQQ